MINNLKKNKKRILFSFYLIITIVFTYKIFFIYNSTITQTYVNWNSMIPTFSNWEKICLFDDYYKNSNWVKNWDIIWFKLKNKGDFMKRVIGTPWDKIIFGKDWYIYINNKKQTENYVKSTQKFSTKNLEILLKQLEYYNFMIPKNMFLVMWDNRFNSIDSGNYWLIDFEHIIWKVQKKHFGYCF